MWKEHPYYKDVLVSDDGRVISLKSGHKGTPVRIVETGETFESQAECAKKINGIQGNIALCLIGKRHTHRGYHFEYVKDGDMDG